MQKEKEVSKDKKAEKLLGLRKPGTPVFMPCELGHACPICGQQGELLDFSEYQDLLYCQNCNIDIPSVLCVKYYTPKLDGKEMTAEQKVHKAKEVLYKTLQDGRKRFFQEIKPEINSFLDATNKRIKTAEKMKKGHEPMPKTEGALAVLRDTRDGLIKLSQNIEAKC